MVDQMADLHHQNMDSENNLSMNLVRFHHYFHTLTNYNYQNIARLYNMLLRHILLDIHKTMLRQVRLVLVDIPPHTHHLYTVAYNIHHLVGQEESGPQATG